MVRQGGHLEEVQDPENFRRNPCRRRFFPGGQVPAEGAGEAGKRGQELVPGEEVHFQVS